MSLINDMLKDIDNNKANPPKVMTGFICQQKSKNEKLYRTAFWYTLPISCLAIFAFIVYGTNITSTKNLMPTTNKNIHSEINKLNQESSTISTTGLNIKKIENSPALIIKSSSTELPSNYETHISTIPDIKKIAALQEAILQNNTLIEEVAPAQVHVNKVFPKLNDKQWEEEQLNKALLEIEQENDGDAISILNNILVKLPTAVAARETLATIYVSQGEFYLAKETINEGLKYSPSTYALNVMKARILYQTGDSKEALEVLMKFKPKLLQDPDYYGLMAAIEESMGNSSEASAIYKALLDVDPTNGQYWLGYAISLEHKKSLRQAVAAYKRAGQNYQADPAVRAYAEQRIKSLQG